VYPGKWLTVALDALDARNILAGLGSKIFSQVQAAPTKSLSRVRNLDFCCHLRLPAWRKLFIKCKSRYLRKEAENRILCMKIAGILNG
jgi:hypothetical protein